MEGDLKLVEYEKYCNTCKHKDSPDTEDPCDSCLLECAVEDSHKPVNYEKEE